ncbi:MAG: phospho-N-acetylmuramoyl-pentapeptide-transferase, partial [Actinomycetota bacterium]|nr:phospho-N-acetylmuramoyl-pentapeptide-transferase [Actinomycetota bacterium]
MINIMLAAIVGLIVSSLATPVAVRRFRRRGWGQLIREEGPKAHYEKRGTPTMGGLVILLATVLGYLVAHFGRAEFTDSGLLAVGTILALGILGFLDDFIKIYKSRSLGLHSWAKFLGQLVIAAVFGVLAVKIVGIGTDISFFRSTA